MPYYLITFSAFKDRRFSPIQPREVETLQVTVSLLLDYETVSHPLDWEVGDRDSLLGKQMTSAAHQASHYVQLNECI